MKLILFIIAFSNIAYAKDIKFDADLMKIETKMDAVEVANSATHKKEEIAEKINENVISFTQTKLFTIHNKAMSEEYNNTQIFKKSPHYLYDSLNVDKKSQFDTTPMFHFHYSLDTKKTKH